MNTDIEAEPRLNIITIFMGFLVPNLQNNLHIDREVKERESLRKRLKWIFDEKIEEGSYKGNG